MSDRLISADKLLRDIKEYHLSDGMFQHWVEVQQTVDAVPVVRCKDCKHLSVRSGALGVYQCAIHGDFPSGEYFCADGERREDE